MDRNERVRQGQIHAQQRIALDPKKQLVCHVCHFNRFVGTTACFQAETGIIGQPRMVIQVAESTKLICAKCFTEVSEPPTLLEQFISPEVKDETNIPNS
jgi:hypothetical protein